MDEKYDSTLLGILQNEGKIDKFLNVIFGFLYRRTDFYRIMKSKEDRLGFSPGVAQNMLLSVFQQYDNLTRQDDKIREARKAEAERSNQQAAEGQKPAEKKVKTSSTAPSNVKTNNAQKPEPSVCKTGEPTVKQNTSDNNSSGDSNNSKGVTHKQSGANLSDGDNNTQPTTDDTEDTEITKQQQKFQENPESYNGAVRDNYSWSQSITDLDLRVKVPEYIRKGRDVKVDIGKKHVKVSHKDTTGQWIVLIDGDLTWEIQKDECMWTLNPGENVHINFEKKDERWWEAVLTDEPKINVRKIDASRPMTDLDDEAQAKIEEMMYNDRMKKIGKPTSQEQKMQDMLKNAWDAEGSPFKGQAFDPSKFSMDSSGVLQMKPS